MEDEPLGEVGLPRNTVFQAMKDALPDHFRCTSESRDLMIRMCQQWVRHVGSLAWRVSEESGKRMMMPDHVVSALSQIKQSASVGGPGRGRWRGDFGSEVQTVASASKEQQTVRLARSHKTRIRQSGLTDEQLLEEQMRIYNRAMAMEGAEENLDRGRALLMMEEEHVQEESVVRVASSSRKSVDFDEDDEVGNDDGDHGNDHHHNKRPKTTTTTTDDFDEF
jgi:hypothetical protein